MIHNRVMSDVAERCTFVMCIHYVHYIKMFGSSGGIAEIDICAHFMVHMPICEYKHMLT